MREGHWFLSPSPVSFLDYSSVVECLPSVYKTLTGAMAHRYVTPVEVGAGGSVQDQSQPAPAPGLRDPVLRQVSCVGSR